jgi:hypothetical protein
MHQAERVIAEGEHRLEALSQAVEARPRIESERRAQDDLEREPLKTGVKLERSVRRPARDLTFGDRADKPRQPRDPLAVKRGQHQAALLHVRLAVEQNHRVGSDHGLEHAGAATGRKHVGRRREDLLDLLGIDDHHERRRHRQPNREAGAITRAATFHVRERARPPPDELNQCRESRSWR